MPNIASAKSVYLLLMIWGEDDKSLLLIVGTDGDYNTVFGRIADIAIDYLEPDEKSDFAPFAETFGENAVEGSILFYQKMSW